MKLFWKIARIVVLVVAALAILAPYIPAAFLRGRAEAALARSLNRPVEIGNIRFTFFPAGPVPGPGFTIENVTIHEEQRAGIEPFAHMPELGASVRVLSLLRGNLEFSGVNFGEASVNLVKTEQGEWNFQYLLNSLREQQAAIPAFRMRGGRVNFKFGDTKSVFFFRDADLDVAPSSGGFDLRFSGDPSRSDHTQQDFGRFFLRGTYAASGDLDFNVELQRSSLEETLRVMDPQGFGVHGVLALKGRLRGAPQQLAITGDLSIGDVHRWDLLPESGQAWTLPYTGTLNLHTEQLDLESKVENFGVRFHANDYLSHPQWSASTDFNAVPLTTLVEIARHMGATLPTQLAVTGTASGSAAYDALSGLTGSVKVTDGSFKLPDGNPAQAAEAALEIKDGVVLLAPTRLVFSPVQAAQVEGSIALAYPHTQDLRITTRGLDVTSLRSFGLPPIPVLKDSPSGTWRGWARYQEEKWTAAAELMNGRFSIDGLAAPLEVDSAGFSIAAGRINVSSIDGRVSGIHFTGSYQERKGSPLFSLTIPEVNASDFEHVFAPLLARAGPGFIQRTLRPDSSAPPAWLAARKAEGTIMIQSATAGDWKAHDIDARITWDGPKIHFAGLTAKVDTATFEGSLDINVATPVAKYRLEGGLNGIAYRGGTLDLLGSVDAEGSGTALVDSARAEGTASGRGIGFAPGAFFRTVRGAFHLQPLGQAPRWKFANIEVAQQTGTLQGMGASQEDGRILLELTQGDRATRYTGTLFASPAPVK
jgi:hypothetical protein